MLTGAAPAPAGQFATSETQQKAVALGTWVFLATELMFFGPLLLSYLHFRIQDPGAFAAASRHTHLWLGTLNTALLLTSSLTMALAVTAARAGARHALRWLIVATALLGMAFLVVKGIEYRREWDDALVPAVRFAFAAEHARGAQIFFYLYFLMTGLHALHLAVGLGLLWQCMTEARRGRFDTGYYAPVEATGLYWHFVDIVWILLYPMFYLVGRYQ